MNIDFNNYYAIGTVVTVKDHPKKLMIIGIAQLNMEEEKFFDYMGVIYPEGYVGPASCVLFNTADIEEVIFEAEKTEDTNFYINTMNTIVKTVNETLAE